MSGAVETTRALRFVMEQENAFLREGRAREASALLESKIAAMDAFQRLMDIAPGLRNEPGLRGEISALQSLANENARFLVAVRNGLGSIVNRITTQAGASYAGTYGEGGRPMAFPQASGGYRKDL